jgi:hypothetical protein
MHGLRAAAIDASWANFREGIVHDGAGTAPRSPVEANAGNAGALVSSGSGRPGLMENGAGMRVRDEMARASVHTASGRRKRSAGRWAW